VSPNTVTDQHYTYDDSGNVTKMADTPTGGGYSDIQCFTYDRYQRVSEAWTPTANDCATAPSNAALGGPAPYWQSYGYNTAGARTQLIDHNTANGDATTTYQYTDSTPADPATGQPHALAGTTTTDSVGTKTAAYKYTKGGQTSTRPGAHGTQTLVWDAEGHVQSVTDTAGSVSYLYDADGNRLISRDTTGKTLYLPGEELRFTNSTSAKTCTRYYSYAGGTVAQRTAAGVAWLGSDHQGTQDVTLDAVTQTATIRRQTPFGTPRGTAVTWPNDKGFVGGTADPTGLTHLGAREYDASLGRFISPDPVLDTGDPQSLEGYAYGGNNPIIHADPSGQMYPKESPGTGSATPDNLVYPQSNPPPSQPSKPKKCGWGCKMKKGAAAAGNWVDDHKAAIAGAVVGAAVGIGCGVAIGWTGVGAIACGAAAGAIGNMVQYAVETEAEHKGNFSLGGMLMQGAVGAVVGGVMGGLGSVAGQAIKSGVSSLVSGIGARAAAKAATPALEKEASGVVSGLAKNAMTKGPSKAASGAAKAAGECAGHSFAASTAVLMANGTTKPIKDVKVGNKVVATDPQTGKRVVRTVLAVHINHDTALTDLTVKVNGHNAVIHTTQHHPVWDASKKMLVDAGDLAAGDELRTAEKTTNNVIDIANFDGARSMYDLTVDTTHTYYVLAGSTPVLVHNCGTVARNALNDAEHDQAKAVADELGGHFEGQSIANDPGIDGAFRRHSGELEGNPSRKCEQYPRPCEHSRQGRG
jgi:RHS repeat-associated protein